MLKDEIEKVLEELYTDSLEDTLYETNHQNRHIKTALTRILELVEKCVPEEDPDPYKQPKISLVHIVQGYNQAIAEIKRRIG